MKEWIVGLTLIAVGSVIGIVALEFGLSKFAPHPGTWGEAYKGFHELDEYIGWKGIPNKERKYRIGRISSSVKLNSHGFRDKERKYEKKKGAFRILVLGDSFTEALQVPLEETFTYVLEERLNSEGISASPKTLPPDSYPISRGSPASLTLDPRSSRGHPGSQRFEVINLGMTGFSTTQEYLTLKHYGLKYQPDFVILAFFYGNDVLENSTLSLQIQDPASRPYSVLNDGKLEEIPFKIEVDNPDEEEEQTKRGVKGQFQTWKDYLKKFIPNTYYSLASRVEEQFWLADFLWKIGIKKSKPRSQDISDIEVPISHGWYLNAEEYPPEWQDAWEVTEALILRMSKELEMNKIGFLVIVIPTELEFNSDIWDETLKSPHHRAIMRILKFDLRKPERILSNFLEANNIDYLLLRPEFEKYIKETNKTPSFPYEYEHHWNTNGHALVAELIYKRLREDKLVPLIRENKQ